MSEKYPTTYHEISSQNNSSEKLLSPEFNELISDEGRLKDLLEGSCVTTESGTNEVAWQEWEKVLLQKN